MNIVRSQKFQVGILLLFATVFAIFLALDVAYFESGSLELFPSDEQQEKIRDVTIVTALLLILAEIGVASLLWRLRRPLGAKRTSAERPSADR